MRLGLILAVILLIVSSIIALGLGIQSSGQKQDIKNLRGELKTLEGLEQNNEALKKNNEALKEELAGKINLIESMRKPLPSDAELPGELVTTLEEWARGNRMAEFDRKRAVVRLKSGLLFKAGQDKVTPAATKVIISLCKIINTQQNEQFDIIIEGHTDNQPIHHPVTLAAHPTNLHLSVHRAISVFYIMTDNGVAPERLSVRGFGEFRPIVPNSPDLEIGTPENRRIEIQFVPKGV